MRPTLACAIPEVRKAKAKLERRITSSRHSGGTKLGGTKLLRHKSVVKGPEPRIENRNSSLFLFSILGSGTQCNVRNPDAV